MNPELNAQEWVDTAAYPFEQHYLELEAGNMHYVDEGQGEVILFVHGTPTWSFLYRDFIREFSQTHRCVAVDHIGFGLSEKPVEFSGTPRAHSENLEAFIQKLDLQNITLVVHDFGGPIALPVAIKHPGRFRRIIMFNTWLWETKTNPDVRKMDKIINSFVGRFLYLQLNFSPKVLLKRGFAIKKKLTRNIHRQYVRPYPNKSSRMSLLRLAQSLAGSSNWYQGWWEQLHTIDNKPWLILWGTEDEFINMQYLKKWRERLPNAKVFELDCGHFVQEEQTEIAIEIIGRELAEIPQIKWK